jgi:hypothetical protein
MNFAHGDERYLTRRRALEVASGCIPEAPPRVGLPMDFIRATMFAFGGH